MCRSAGILPACCGFQPTASLACRDGGRQDASRTLSTPADAGVTHGPIAPLPAAGPLRVASATPPQAPSSMPADGVWAIEDAGQTARWHRPGLSARAGTPASCRRAATGTCALAVASGTAGVPWASSPRLLTRTQGSTGGRMPSVLRTAQHAGRMPALRTTAATWPAGTLLLPLRLEPPAPRPRQHPEQERPPPASGTAACARCSRRATASYPRRSSRSPRPPG